MKARYFNFSSFFLLVTLMVFSACKKEFDEPPVSSLPNIQANATIADVIALANTTPVALGEQILEATVVADDKSGNFYKQLIVQDATGGIRLDIDAFGLYNEYPIGRKVWIKCKGLFIWQDGDVPALIGSSNTNDSRIPQASYREYIIGGEYDKPVTPTVRTLATLTAADYHTLVQLDNVEFADCFAGSSYAYPSTQQSKNAELTDCNTGNTIIVRNSGFADFAGQLMPTQNGSIIAVYNSFNGTPQLFIRDPRDVSTMTGTRCVTLGNYQEVTIQALRAQYTGTATVAAGKIKGIVISDPTTGQWQSRNVVIQAPNGSGITIRFNDDHQFMLGDYAEVKVGGGTLEEFNGLLQVNNIDNCRATTLPNPSGLSVTARVATVNDVLANANAWESTLINVQNASLGGGATYGDFGVTLSDATGTIGMFSGFANFAATPLPTGTGDVTAVVGDFNGVQLNIRNLGDVNITGSGGGGGGGGSANLISIQDARNLFMGSPVTATANTKIKGIVISDQSTANWQDRNMVIQEAGGSGITVRFAASHSFNLGDEVEVVISGETIEEFNGLLQINNVPNANATVLSTGNSITPRVATITDIIANGNAWESTLLTIQSANITGGSTYSGSLTINDPTGTIPMFTRFGATFASSSVPTGTGSVTGVLGDFNGEQINIRNTSDVNITGGGGGGGSVNYITIGAARALFTGSNTTVSSNTGIAGIVISNTAEGNITARNIVIQQTGGSGIVVRFDANNSTIDEGDSITVDISNGTISEFNGLLQVSGIANANATVVSSGNSITPRVATVADINTNGEAWESTLVQITGATITGAATYSGSTTVADATATIPMFTRSAATFSGNNVPAGTVSVTAIVSEFNGRQINIRKASDVQ